MKNLFRKIVFFLLLIESVVFSFGDNLLRDTLQHETGAGIENKGALFQPLTIYYQAGQFYPRKDDCTLIEKFLSVTMNNSSVSYIISGFTDRQGSADYNQRLSGLRAEEVQKILLGKGIPETRITIKALGESLSENVSPLEYHKMRKVEIRTIIMMK